MKIELMDGIAILIISINIILALSSSNFHSAMGWALGVYLYFIFMTYRDVNILEDEK